MGGWMGAGRPMPVPLSLKYSGSNSGRSRRLRFEQRPLTTRATAAPHPVELGLLEHRMGELERTATPRPISPGSPEPTPHPTSRPTRPISPGSPDPPVRSPDTRHYRAGRPSIGCA
jgi:hypothetical protein